MPSSDPTLGSLFSLKGKVALVTGAGAGIGRAIARTLALAGEAKVAINDLASSSGHHTLAAELTGKGHAAIAVDADVSDAAAVRAMIAEVEETLGPVDILVNNAGIALPRTIAETEPEDWERVLAIHLGGAYLASRLVLPGMKARRSGAIVQLSSIVAHQGALKGHIAYGTAKAGLLGFTRSLARDAGPSNVRVNAIAPGIVDTEMLWATHGEAGIAELKKAVPLGTLASVDDIAAAALFLVSPAASHITGTTLDVAGGMVMR